MTLGHFCEPILIRKSIIQDYCVYINLCWLTLTNNLSWFGNEFSITRKNVIYVYLNQFMLFILISDLYNSLSLTQMCL
jgi:hypothetical protein